MSKHKSWPERVLSKFSLTQKENKWWIPSPERTREIAPQSEAPCFVDHCRRRFASFGTTFPTFIYKMTVVNTLEFSISWPATIGADSSIRIHIQKAAAPLVGWLIRLLSSCDVGEEQFVYSFNSIISVRIPHATPSLSHSIRRERLLHKRRREEINWNDCLN